MERAARRVAIGCLVMTAAACAARPLPLSHDAASAPVDATVEHPSDLAVSPNDTPILGLWATGTGTLTICGDATPLSDGDLVVQVDYAISLGNPEAWFSIYYINAGDSHIAGTRDNGKNASVTPGQTFHAGYPPTTIDYGHIQTVDGVTAHFELTGTSAGCAVAVDATLHRDGTP